MAGLTPAHLLIILVVALIVIGPGKLPEVGAAIGKSIREFQKASGGITDILTGSVTQPAPPAQAPQPIQAQPAQYQPAQYQPTQPQPPAQSYYAAQAAPPAYPAPMQAAPAYPAPAYPSPAYPAPMQSAPVYPAPMQAVPGFAAPVQYPVMTAVEPAPATLEPTAPAQPPAGHPQPDPIVQEPPLPPSVG